jgi:hypothetical protein
MSQFACIKGSNCYILPDNVPLDVGALVEPLSVAWHAVRLSQIKAGETAVVMGGGPSKSSVHRLSVLKSESYSRIPCHAVLER